MSNVFEELLNNDTRFNNPEYFKNIKSPKKKNKDKIDKDKFKDLRKKK